MNSLGSSIGLDPSATPCGVNRASLRSARSTRNGFGYLCGCESSHTHRGVAAATQKEAVKRRYYQFGENFTKSVIIMKKLSSSSRRWCKCSYA